MLQIYDRVLPGHSLSTLIAFSILALILFVTHGCLDLIRTRLMARLGAVLDIKLADLAFNQHTQVFGDIAAGSEALRDLDDRSPIPGGTCRGRTVGCPLAAALHGHHFSAAPCCGLGGDRQRCRLHNHCRLQ